MKTIALIILTIAEILLAMIVKEANEPSTVIDGDRDRSRRERLLRRVRATKNRLSSSR
ncbi:MAG TPA: hypothetical protein VMY37_25230 [Thermoguttaceae bacterium]|nr:hypothetical protein [Thermoguttaceae bacterium]